MLQQRDLKDVFQRLDLLIDRLRRYKQFFRCVSLASMARRLNATLPIERWKLAPTIYGYFRIN